MDTKQPFNPEQLFTVYFDGGLSDEQRRQLVEWLKVDKRHVRQFVYASFIHRSMYDILCGQDAQKLIGSGDESDAICADDFWKALLEEEKTAPSVQLDPPASYETGTIVPDRSGIPKSRGYINRFAWGTALASLAAFVFLLFYVHINPRFTSEPVAVVTDMINIQRQESDTAIRIGERLFTRQGPMRLDKGIVKIRFDNGADVVIEGPSVFELITYDEISLSSGRLYANVPHRTLGFIVSTPNAKVIDMGTGFGVFADATGGTDVHVLDGKVSLVSGMRSNVRQSQVVSVHQACRVEKDSEIIRPIAFQNDVFVQDIDSKTHFVWRGQPLNLADIVGGGNGLGTGQREVSLDPSSGRLLTDIPRDRFQRNAPYVGVPQVGAVDGLFIPDGTAGPVQVSSAGHTFNCPPTLGECYYGVFTGPRLTMRVSAAGDVEHRIQYRGQFYGTEDRPILLLHTNLGITFDLDAIRRTLPPGGRITAFSAGCAISEGPEGSKRPGDYSDFFVLVDGVERFSVKDMNYLSEMIPAEVPLTDSNRFLTLMTTEGKDRNIHLGWAFFAEPKLHVQRTEQEP